MTVTEQAPTALVGPVDVDQAIAWITERLRTKSPEQVITIGERTGWWSADLVEWVFDGGNGEPPTATSPAPVAPTVREDQEPADRGVVEPAAQPPTPASLAAQPRAIEPMTSEQAAAEVARVQAAHAAPPIWEQPAADVEPQRPMAGSAYVTVLQGRELGVDRSYQRPLDQPRVKRMAENWDPRMVGTIDVSDRGEGAGPIRYAVINGQHRAAAAAAASPVGADVWLACTVHEGLTVADEARLMHEMDRATKKLTGFDQWRARRGAGDVVVLEVEAIAGLHGLRVGPEPTDGTLRSYGAAEKLLKVGGRDLLDATLAVLSAAYAKAQAGYQAPLLTAVGQVLHRNPGLDVDRLVTALASNRPEQLRATATALREAEGGPLNQLMARAVAGAYNRTQGSGPRIVSGR